MELSLQTPTVKKENGNYRHTILKTYRPARKTNTVYQYQCSGFYYIGKNAAYIDKLVKIYNSGYASDGMENVMVELLKSLAQEKNVLPEVIVCEGKFDISDIIRFRGFLNQHNALKSIPFILEGSGLDGERLEQYRRQARPDEILFLEHCKESHFDQKVRFLRKVKAQHQHGVDKVPCIERNMVRRRYENGRIGKRVFDILCAGTVLLLLSPLFLLIAILIKIESRGPVFYIAKRAGEGYRIFNFYKFRTMINGADKKISQMMTHLNQYKVDQKSPVFFKASNDPRITKVGKFLRNTSLDELPQLINVLLGDMSLVGNRPLPLYEAETLTTDEFAARFMAPAGITGLWQVKKRGQKDMSAEERISMDIDYANKHSFATDFWIIASTPSALLQKENV